MEPRTLCMSKTLQNDYIYPAHYEPFLSKYYYLKEFILQIYLHIYEMMYVTRIFATAVLVTAKDWR